MPNRLARGLTQLGVSDHGPAYFLPGDHPLPQTQMALSELPSYDEGMALANDSAYGLSAYVFTKDLRRLMRLTRELKFGEIYVNRPGGDAVHAYHSGYRHSGLGGEDGKYGLEGYLRKKTIYVNYS